MTMPSNVSTSLYNEFKKWAVSKFGSYAGMALKQTADILKNKYFQAFLVERGYSLNDFGVEEEAVADESITIDVGEDAYGAELNYPEKGYVTLPDGEVVALNYWQGLSHEEKINRTGGYVANGMIQDKTGKFYALESLGVPEGTAIRDIVAGYKPDEAVEPAQDMESYGGYTAEEWAYGVPSLDWQKQQYELDSAQYQAELERQQKQSKWERDQAMAEMATANIWQNMSAIQNQTTPFDDTIQSQQNAKLFEEMRQQILDELEPTDWASKYIVENKANPYATQTENPLGDAKEQVSYLNSQKKAYEHELNKLEDKLNDTNDPLYRTETIAAQEKALENTINFIDEQINAVEAGPINSQLADMANQNNVDYIPWMQTALRYSQNPNSEEFANLSTSEQTDLMRSAQALTAQPVKAKTPELEVPTWMRQYIAGSPTTISNTNMGTAITPSAQSWTRLTPTQQSIWSDYVGVSGGNTEDLLSQTSNMLTKPLSLGRTWANA